MLSLEKSNRFTPNAGILFTSSSAKPIALKPKLSQSTRTSFSLIKPEVSEEARISLFQLRNALAKKKIAEQQKKLDDQERLILAIYKRKTEFNLNWHISQYKKGPIISTFSSDNKVKYYDIYRNDDHQNESIDKIIFHHEQEPNINAYRSGCLNLLEQAIKNNTKEQEIYIDSQNIKEIYDILLGLISAKTIIKWLPENTQQQVEQVEQILGSINIKFSDAAIQIIQQQASREEKERIFQKVNEFSEHSNLPNLEDTDVTSRHSRSLRQASK